MAEGATSVGQGRHSTDEHGRARQNDLEIEAVEHGSFSEGLILTPNPHPFLQVPKKAPLGSLRQDISFTSSLEMPGPCPRFCSSSMEVAWAPDQSASSPLYHNRN